MLLETKEQFMARIDPIIVTQANKQHKGSEILEVDDIAQEIRVHFLEKYEHVKGLKDESISYIAYRAAATYCADEREKYMYNTGGFVYFGELVEYLLKNDTFVELDGDTDVEGRVDVLTAIESLSPGQRDAIHLKYRDDADLTKTQQKAAERGLRAITTYLNRGVKKSRVELNIASEVI